MVYVLIKMIQLVDYFDLTSLCHFTQHLSDWTYHTYYTYCTYITTFKTKHRSTLYHCIQMSLLFGCFRSNHAKLINRVYPKIPGQDTLISSHLSYLKFYWFRIITSSFIWLKLWLFYFQLTLLSVHPNLTNYLSSVHSYCQSWNLILSLNAMGSSN